MPTANSVVLTLHHKCYPFESFSCFSLTVKLVAVATVGFATHFKFPSGGTPNLPTASGSISLISFSVHKTGAAGTTLLAGASVNFS